jgi:hypothetical protein
VELLTGDGEFVDIMSGCTSVSCTFPRWSVIEISFDGAPSVGLVWATYSNVRDTVQREVSGGNSNMVFHAPHFPGLCLGPNARNLTYALWFLASSPSGLGTARGCDFILDHNRLFPTGSLVSSTENFSECVVR